MTEIKPDTTGWRRTLACCTSKAAGLLHHWRAALFMACLLHLPSVKMMLVPLETGAQAWASAVQHIMGGSEPSSDPKPYGVVLISPERFETQYAGRRPLPRRALLHDLKQLPDKTFVALDLDISPMPVGSPGIGPSSDDRDDESALYEYIAANADRFLLILPFPVQDPVNRNAKASWLVAMCKAGVTFSDPRIELTWGVAIRDLAHANLSFATIIRHISESKEKTAEHEQKTPLASFQPSGGLCAGILSGERFKHPLASTPTPSPQEIVNASILLTPGQADAQMDHLSLEHCKAVNANPDGCDDQREGQLLAFGKGQARFTQFSWCGQGQPFENTSCGPQPVPAPTPHPRLVIFGGDYDLADRFATPLGYKSGAYLHAVSAQEASAVASHVASLLADFLLGLGFGLVAHELWALWFDARRRRTRFRLFGLFPCTLIPQTSWIALGLLALSLTLLTILALLLAVWLLVTWDIWLSPIPMMVGMTLDAMVLGSAGAAAEKMGGVRPYDDPPPLANPGLFKSFVFHVPQLCWLAVVAWVLGGIAKHWFFH